MGGTPPEEIKCQHDEAISLLGMASVERIDEGEIPLTQKQHPTFDTAPRSLLSVSPIGPLRPEEEKKKDHGGSSPSVAVTYISSRGDVDVSALRDLLREGYNEPKENMNDEDMLLLNAGKKAKQSSKAEKVYSLTNLWDETNASINNVAVVRPSHDAWGIKKVVLMFCDDFLSDVFEMPWWHLREDIRQAVQPILDTLHVQPNRIVRMLLAALPPGVTIPVHHDTGEWVRHSHRVHVPVLVTDPNKVLFRCGLTPTALSRIDCEPGHVFEMNNQAKHAVSNCGDDHRVHLILDFVDESFNIKRRVALDPGEQLLQTRRSIDLLAERGTRRTPSYLILGAQKAGTTSLYEYIVQHPLAVRARRRETHCLDWRWNHQAKSTKARREHCHQFFMTKELELHPSCLTGDSTPSYLLDARRVIPRLKEVFPHAPLQFFVMVRDPVARAFSHYQMVTSSEGTPEQLKVRGGEWRALTFEQVVEKEMAQLKEYGLIPYWDTKEGCIDMDAFESFSGSKAEDDAWDRFMKDIPLSTGSHSLLARGLYDLQLRPWFKFFARERFLIIRLEDMKNEGVSPIMDKVWDHLELPRFSVKDDSPKNARAYDPMPEDSRSYLQRFYAPHNKKLSESLAITGWDY
jgi:hypothetical protein